MRNKFCKVILASNQPQAFALGQAPRKAITGQQALREIAHAHHRRVHLAAQGSVRRSQRTDKLCKAGRTEHHHIHVA